VVDSDITITKPVKLVGSNSGGVFRRPSPTTIDASGGDGISWESNLLVLEDIRLTGDKTAGSVGLKDLHDGTLQDSLELRNVSVDNFEVGIHLAKVNSPHFGPVYAGDTVSDAIRFAGPNASDYISALTGQIMTYLAGRDGIRVDFSAAGEFSGADVSIQLENSDGWGFNHVGGTMWYNEFSGYGTESNTLGSMQLQTGHNTSIITCRLREDNGPTVSDGKAFYQQGGALKTYGGQFAIEAVANPVHLQGTNLEVPTVNEYNQAANADLAANELALDTNVDGAGTRALLYKADNGTVYQFNADGSF
jgi:hypothetical protein